jgi:predicted nucleotidyltransferase
MRREEIIAKLKQAEPALRRAGVEALYLFGSIARGDERPDSDIDLFVDPKSDEEFGFLEFMDAYQAIQEAVGNSADIGYSTRAGLSRHIRPSVEKEAIRVF